jgi:hypothetical protein
MNLVEEIINLQFRNLKCSDKMRENIAYYNIVRTPK